jgi:hypothetical protein
VAFSVRVGDVVWVNSKNNPCWPALVISSEEATDFSIPTGVTRYPQVCVCLCVCVCAGGGGGGRGQGAQTQQPAAQFAYTPGLHAPHAVSPVPPGSRRVSVRLRSPTLTTLPTRDCRCVCSTLGTTPARA